MTGLISSEAGQLLSGGNPKDKKFRPENRQSSHAAGGTRVRKKLVLRLLCKILGFESLLFVCMDEQYPYPSPIESFHPYNEPSCEISLLTKSCSKTSVFSFQPSVGPLFQRREHDLYPILLVNPCPERFHTPIHHVVYFVAPYLRSNPLGCQLCSTLSSILSISFNTSRPHIFLHIGNVTMPIEFHRNVSPHANKYGASGPGWLLFIAYLFVLAVSRIHIHRFVYGPRHPG